METKGLLDIFIDLYYSAYYVNLNTFECEILKLPKYRKDIDRIDNYYTKFIEYFAKDVHPDDRDEVFDVLKPDNIRRLLKDKKEYVTVFRDLSGKNERYIKMVIFRGLNEDEAGIAFLNVTSEIRNQKERILGAIPLSPEILDNANIGLWSLEMDEDSKPRMYVDDIMLKMMGVSEHMDPEKTFSSWYKRVDPKYIKLVNEAMQKAIDGGVAEVQYDWHASNGKVYTCRTGGRRNFSYVRGIRIEGVHQNVSEIIHYEDERIKKSKQDIVSLLISSLSEHYLALYDIDAESGTYQLFNIDKEYGENVDSRLIHGTNFFEDTCKSLRLVVYREDWDKIKPLTSKEAMEETFGDKRQFIFDYRIVTDKEIIWYRVKAVKFIGSDKSSRYAVGVINIEDEVNNKRLLETALETAKSASKAKTDFLFNMSHDIRTPMNAILGYTDIALKHQDNENRVRDSLTKIKAAGGHLLTLINDILEMSKIESGKIIKKNTRLDLRDILSNIDHMSVALASTKDITFNCKINHLENPYIIGDELHFNQIIVNIISNAVKYTNYGGIVECYVDQITSVENGEAKYRFIVKDNGIGMSEEFMQHLFEPFAREDRISVNKEEGTGLGLSIVKRLLDFHGGTISVSSKKNEGSMFTIEMPFKVLSEKETSEFILQKSSQQITTKADLKGKKILLVEDNVLNREITLDILSEAGLNVDTASDGVIAVRKMREKGPFYYNAILMDIQMPIMNGYEATKNIRKMYPDVRIPIIALSANAFEEDKKASLDAGMDDHVSKPINIAKLLKALSTAMSK